MPRREGGGAARDAVGLVARRVDRGDELMVLETPDGIRLTPYDPEFAARMDLAEDIMREDRDLLRKLAE